jgi:choline dehydrogenase
MGQTPIRADVVVVGAGAAGAVLAARLSEDADRSVLLIDAGEMTRDLSRAPAPVIPPRPGTPST